MGKEPGRQYVGYQYFDFACGADAMNEAGDKERVRFITMKVRINGWNGGKFVIIPV